MTLHVLNLGRESYAKVFSTKESDLKNTKEDETEEEVAEVAEERPNLEVSKTVSSKEPTEEDMFIPIKLKSTFLKKIKMRQSFENSNLATYLTYDSVTKKFFMYFLTTGKILAIYDMQELYS